MTKAAASPGFMSSTCVTRDPALPARSGFDGFMLLEEFCAHQGVALPSIRRVAAPDVPSPYHELLVHSNDMTPTLQTYFGRPLRVSVLDRYRQDNHYFREVVLRPVGAGRPVEYGIIKIDLARFTPLACVLVLQEQKPLGQILMDESLAHTSWPQAFFRVTADSHIQSALELSQRPELFGRRNLILDGQRRLLADVVEILPVIDLLP